MKLILVICLFLGPALNGFGQETISQDFRADFFYGTWTDSTKTGMTLKSDMELLMIEKKPGSGFEDPKSVEGVRWTYNLILDRRPIVIEIFCNQCDNKPVPRKLTGHIEVINDQQIYFSTVNEKGQELMKIKLTRS